MLRTFIASLGLVAALAGVAHGGILFNEDSRTHEISFQRGNGRVKAQVQPNKAVLFECSQLPCTLTLESSGQKLRLETNDQDVVIEGGVLRAKHGE